MKNDTKTKQEQIAVLAEVLRRFAPKTKIKVPRRPPVKTVELTAIRRAVADYMGSEGCHCCEGGNHDQHRAALAKLLKIPKDKHNSYNFNRYRAEA